MYLFDWRRWPRTLYYTYVNDFHGAGARVGTSPSNRLVCARSLKTVCFRGSLDNGFNRTRLGLNAWWSVLAKLHNIVMYAHNSTTTAVGTYGTVLRTRGWTSSLHNMIIFYAVQRLNFSTRPPHVIITVLTVNQKPAGVRVVARARAERSRIILHYII